MEPLEQGGGQLEVVRGAPPPFYGGKERALAVARPLPGAPAPGPRVDTSSTLDNKRAGKVRLPLGPRPRYRGAPQAVVCSPVPPLPLRGSQTFAVCGLGPCGALSRNPPQPSPPLAFGGVGGVAPGFAPGGAQTRG